jgi:hypothetical protein
VGIWCRVGVSCGRAGWATRERVKHGGASGLHPTLGRSAKDGAPGILRLVEGRPAA